MTDDEIIKALEHCSEAESCIWCKYEPTEHQKVTVGCCYGLIKKAIDLIKRHQAEIERYKGVIKILEKDVSTAKTDGVKEFSEKLKDYAWYYDVNMRALDRLEKEMLEAINGA